jgi:hypothetical protein
VTTRRVIFVAVLALTGPALSDGASASDLWDERSLRITQTVPANFPAALAAEGVSEGEVRAVLHVDARGKLLDCLVTAYTGRELADALLAVVPEWRYEPPRQRGEAVGARTEAVFAFQARGMVVSLTPTDSLAAAANRLVKPVVTSLLCRPSELDEPVRVLDVVEPQHPRIDVELNSGRPTVTVDFYIDTTGRVRVPAVLRATHELYAVAAIDALTQWRFMPPTRHGRAVIVRATQVFWFPESTSRPSKPPRGDGGLQE